MGRLEKQIITGAVALVAILLVVVLVKGIDQGAQGGASDRKSEWQDPTLLLSTPDGRAKPQKSPRSAASQLAKVVDFEAEAQASEAAGSASNLTKLDQGSTASGNAATTDVSPAPAAAKSSQPAVPVVASSQAATKVNLDWDEDLRLYVVRDNESLSEIAQREVGSIHYLGSILELNEGLSANKIFAGQEIWLPSEQTAKRTREQSRVAKSGASAAAKATSVKKSGRVHTVVSGDSLWRIARKYYPSKDRNAAIKRIVKANPELKSENSVLELGSELKVPR